MNGQILARDLSKKGTKIEHRNFVNLRYKCLQVIDQIIEKMYAPNVLILMEKEGYLIDYESIKTAKEHTKKKMVSRHLDGKTTKHLSGSLSELKQDLETLNF